MFRFLRRFHIKRIKPIFHVFSKTVIRAFSYFSNLLSSGYKANTASNAWEKVRHGYCKMSRNHLPLAAIERDNSRKKEWGNNGALVQFGWKHMPCRDRFESIARTIENKCQIETKISEMCFRLFLQQNGTRNIRVHKAIFGFSFLRLTSGNEADSNEWARMILRMNGTFGRDTDPGPCVPCFCP